MHNIYSLQIHAWLQLLDLISTNFAIFTKYLHFLASGGLQVKLLGYLVFCLKFCPVVFCITEILKFKLGLLYYSHTLPKVAPEYTLLGFNSVSFTFVLSIILIIAFFRLRRSEKHRKLLFKIAAPLAFSLYIKFLVFFFKWEAFSVFNEIAYFLTGNSNSEQKIIIVFTFLFLIFSIAASFSELSLNSFIIGFVFLSFDALMSYSLYSKALCYLQNPFATSVPAGNTSLFCVVLGVFLAYFCFYMLLPIFQLFLDGIFRFKKTKRKYKKQFVVEEKQ